MEEPVPDCVLEEASDISSDSSKISPISSKKPQKVKHEDSSDSTIVMQPMSTRDPSPFNPTATTKEIPSRMQNRNTGSACCLLL